MAVLNYNVGLLADIQYGINRKIDSLKTEFSNVDDVVRDAKICMSELLGLPEAADVVDSAYCDFLVKVGILAYLGKLDNDVNFNKLSEEQSRVINVENESGVEEVKEVSLSDELEFKFAFDGYTDIIYTSVEALESLSRDHADTLEKIQSNLLGQIRNISVSEYVSSKALLSNDIELIVLLGSKPKINMNDGIREFIKSNNVYRSYHMELVTGILKVYKYMFQDSFGLRPYKGVAITTSPFTYDINDNFKLGTIRNAETTFESVMKVLKAKMNIETMPDRQFDVRAIIYSSGNTIMYYAKKLLEYSLGRELTTELSENIYKPYARRESWDAYEEGYVRPQIEEYALEAIYYAIEKNIKFKDFYWCDLKDKVKSDKFDIGTDSDFNKYYSEPSHRDKIEREILMSESLRSRVYEDLQYFKKCVCTSVSIIDYNVLGGSINSIAVRVVDTSSNLSVDMTSSLFSRLTTNTNIQFDTGTLISEGKTIDGSTPLPFDILEYRHNFNSALSNAEPLFGYTAVDLFKNRGIPINWGRILLGEDIKGTPIFASTVDSDDLPMQKFTVHNMMAGSRSGKGVMTMNILSCASAAEKPIFYIDRKPDMAVMFYELSGGNMFVVNGGQYEQKNDPRNRFSDSGDATQGWLEAYRRMPDYLKTLFPSETYVGNFGDYVYYRAVMFMLGILMARVELSGNSEIYSNLGGENGITIVIDEFKNWQTVFESVFFTSQGKFGNENRIGVTKKLEEYKKLSSDLRIKEAELASVTDTSSPRYTRIQLNIEAIKDKIKSLVTPLQAYCTTVMDKYGESCKHISSKLSAGFKDSEGPLSDIFVIGQHIEIDGYDGSTNKSGTYPERDSGMFNINEETKGKSLMRGLLDSFLHDWFMGYNNDGSEQRKYIGADIEGSSSNKWVFKNMYWGYIPNVPMESLRSGVPSGIRYFKPYLVLNNSREDDPNNPKKLIMNGKSILDPDYTFVTQCRKRVNEAVPGAELWETVRLKHLSESNRQDAISGVNKHYDELNEGIGFEGLARLTKSTTSNIPFIPTEDFNKSAIIANYVAQKLGYSSYKDFLYDFSPNGLFSTQDIVNAIVNPSTFQDKSKVLPIFDTFGLLDNSSTPVILDDSPLDIVYNSDSENDLYSHVYTNDTQSYTYDTESSDNDSYSSASSSYWYDDDEDEDFYDEPSPEVDFMTTAEGKAVQVSKEHIRVSDEELRNFCKGIMDKVVKMISKPLTPNQYNFYVEFLVQKFREMGY